MTLNTPIERNDAFEGSLYFSDGHVTQIQVMSNETVLSAAAGYGVMLRSECTLGTCGTCKAQCSDGLFELETDDGLTVMERRRGYVLTCVMHLHSDCRLNFGYPYSEQAAVKEHYAHGQIQLIEMVSESVCRLVVSLPSDEAFEFFPGQYVNVSVPGTIEARSYSFANSPLCKDSAEFFIRLLEEGAMSNYLRQSAKKGDTVSLLGPFGSFYLKDMTCPIVMVAGGTGLAPMLSMLDHLVNEGHTEHQVKLLIGVNRMEDIFCMERLQGYTRSLKSFRYYVAVAEPHPAWEGHTGFVTSMLDEEDIKVGNVDIYVCGPPAMTEATASWLAAHDVSDERIHTEKFSPSC